MQSETNYLYFVEKMNGVLSELLVHPGTARQRLMEVRIELFLHLPVPMPTEFSKKRWQFVNEKLSKKPDAFGQPAITNSIKSMRDSTASKVIGAIRDTVYEVSLYQDADQS